MTTTTRETALQVELGPSMALHVHGWGAESTGTACEAELDVAPDQVVVRASRPELVGHPVGSGMRRRVAGLPGDAPEDHLLRRLLDDLPVLSRVALQALLVDHPRLPGLGVMDTRGADQCSGWASDGTMLTQVARAGGELRMRLTEPVEPWDGLDLEPLPAMATRRRRRLEVADDGDALALRARYRDSFSDPDGVERGLHAYVLTAVLDGDGVVREIGAEGLTLPWPECWTTTGSAERLVGTSVLDVDDVARRRLTGLGSCTHLTDTLRSLRDAVRLARGG